jgi:hypothetical protein
MTPEQDARLREEARKAAEALLGVYVVGWFEPGFCDEPGEFEQADAEDVAKVLLPHVQALHERAEKAEQENARLRECVAAFKRGESWHMEQRAATERERDAAQQRVRELEARLIRQPSEECCPECHYRAGHGPRCPRYDTTPEPTPNPGFAAPPESGKEPPASEPRLADDAQRCGWLWGLVWKQERECVLTFGHVGATLQPGAHLMTKSEALREQAEQLAEAFADECVMERAIEGIHAALHVAARDAAKEALEALREIAGVETGAGIHRPCCARGRAIALRALAAHETGKGEAGGQNPDSGLDSEP